MDSTETVKAVYVKQIGKIQTVAQTVVKCADVRKVLATNATVSVRVSETLTGEVRLSGRECVDLVILTSDGIRRESGWTDFTDRAEAEGITPTSRVTATARVLDTDVVSVDNDNVTLASVIEITLEAEECSVIPFAPPQTDGVFTGDSRLTMSGLVTRFSGKSEPKSEEKLSCAKIVCAHARACVTSAEAALDAVTVMGDVYVDGMGMTEEGGLQPFSLVLPMSEELAAEGARRGDAVQVRVLSATVNTEENEDGITIAVTVELAGAVFSELAVSCATDAFSPDCAVELTKLPVVCPTVHEIRCHEETAEGTVMLPEGENADKILAVCDFRLSSVNAYPDGGRAVVEGAVSGSIVYADAEAGKKSAVGVELPFRITTETAAQDGWTVDVSGSVGKVGVRPSRLGELNVKCGLCLCLRVTEFSTVEIVTDVKCGDAFECCKGTVSLHVASAGESAWDCAKALSVSPDTVLMQNPDLEFPLKKNDKVFVFRTK